MMSLRTLFAVLLSGTALLVGGGAGCSMLTGAGGESEARQVEFLVAEVDSLDVPAQIAPTDTLAVRMKGTIGPNSCYGFEAFDVARSTGRLRVTPVVAHSTADNIACAMAVEPLDRTYTAAPPFAEGTLTVTVPQPDRPDVTASVTITDEE
jgi:hypothetical protein